MMAKKRRKGAQPFISGYCRYNPHQYPCSGEFRNGSAVTPPTTLCSCYCHGNYEERMKAAGYRIAKEDPEEMEADDQE